MGDGTPIGACVFHLRVWGCRCGFGCVGVGVGAVVCGGCRCGCVVACVWV